MVVDYPWSSLPHYASAPSKRPEWLDCQRGLGVFALEDTIAGRRRFLRRVQARAEAEEASKCGFAQIEDQSLNSTLKRGWCFGSERFREKLLELVETVLEPKARNDNYAGSELRDHGEKTARRLIDEGLNVLELQPDQLAQLRKSDLRKTLIAHAVRSQTTVGLKWISKRLEMGTSANVSQQCRRLPERLKKDRRARKLAKAVNDLSKFSS